MDAGFIRPCQYPDWVANVVLVPKPNGTWRMCVDYTDLNKACPKDSFPLPKIDRLVDSTAGHAMMSFMDAYSGFHQIPLWPEDQEKTSFVTEQGLYCYKASNNEAEYEALICGIQMSRAAGATDVLVLSDSQLIVSQVKGEYEAKHEAMIRYLEKVRQEAQQLSNFEVKHIPRSENNKADALSKLASSASCDTPRHVFWEPVLLGNPYEKNIKSLGEMQTNALPKD
ncbi:uncharacterized protein [Spinacia oleracea]|uniref:RNase H type-1 domain-containing protein n=1 Tax=Spinacia oleracea TaxID=3562 RepID=A0ABM3R8E5_SPIOL|nr:uncharacterized protein LOC130467404 [Spinacia oleracea]